MAPCRTRSVDLANKLLMQLPCDSQAAFTGCLALGKASSGNEWLWKENLVWWKGLVGFGCFVVPSGAQDLRTPSAKSVFTSKCSVTLSFMKLWNSLNSFLKINSLNGGTERGWSFSETLAFPALITRGSVTCGSRLVLACLQRNSLLCLPFTVPGLDKVGEICIFESWRNENKTLNLVLKPKILS